MLCENKYKSWIIIKKLGILYGTADLFMLQNSKDRNYFVAGFAGAAPCVAA